MAKKCQECQPLYIVSVNTTPHRAHELLVILIEELAGQYDLVHVANTETIEGVRPMLESLVVAPEVLIDSSQWTTGQQAEIEAIARSIIPGIKTVAIPPGLNATKGGDAVVAFLKEQFLGLGLPIRASATARNGGYEIVRDEPGL